ncbi:hypothetical protein EGW08_005659 [Elysia chlorotica]|uniref:Neurotransmitter-gated ion-channel ligand-binding domain-containing protein n=1 Tax=Elysia chlorotica TaxID=188477 RepID=A0A3S1BLP1_ELYCH|nr:hypothetical protein EGW08_005659 [Elysia chlorotica]
MGLGRYSKQNKRDKTRISHNENEIDAFNSNKLDPDQYKDLSYGQTYSDALTLFDTVLGNSSAYNPRIIPTLDQGSIINVSVEFSLISILALDDKRQELITNGFLGLEWEDEIVQWDPQEYGLTVMYVYPKDVWRPRLILWNTLGERDLFKDDYSPTLVKFNGHVNWYPGSLFPVSCKLNLEKFPFDRQTCVLELFAMGWTKSILRFLIEDEGVDLDSYTINGEWEIISTSIKIDTGEGLAGFRVEIVIQRRSGFFVLNIVMPVVLLSFLNIVVFLIPVDSGEKISYGITVLLALTVFMSIVGDMLPRRVESSDIVPLVTIYLFVLLVISVLTVMVAIIIVWLHHKDEQETKRQEATHTFRNLFKKVRLFKKATTPSKKVMPEPSNDQVDPENADPNPGLKIDKGMSLMKAVQSVTSPEKALPPVVDTEPQVNKYKLIGRHIDTIAFFIFLFMWVSVTLAFTIKLNS